MLKKKRIALIALTLFVLTIAGCTSPNSEVNNGQSKTPEGTSEPTYKPTEDGSSLSILAFEAAEHGADEIDLSGCTMLEVSVSYCEYAEPVQYFTDAVIIAKAQEAISCMKVTGLADMVSSTGESESYTFLDSRGNAICGFSFQDGLLLGKDGRYSVDGLDALFSIEGIKLAGEWKEYWEKQDELKSDYEWGYKIFYPSTVFELGGYWTNLLYKNIDLADIVTVNVKISWSDVESFTSSNRDDIEAIYTALCDMKVTGETSSGATWQKWTVTFWYKVPSESFYSSAYLSFYGNCFISDFAQGGNTIYAVSGIETLFDAADAEVLKFLKENCI